MLHDAWTELDDAIERLDLFSSSALPQLTHGISHDCHMLVREKSKKIELVEV